VTAKAEEKLRQGALREHGFVSKPVDATNVRGAAITEVAIRKTLANIALRMKPSFFGKSRWYQSGRVRPPA